MSRTWLLAVMMLFGCGDNLPTIALGDLDQARLQARCEYLTRCDLFESTEACLAFHNLIVDANLQAAVDAGKTRYDAVLGTRCIDELAAASCNQTSRSARVLASCNDMLRGTLRAAESCVFGDECASGVCEFTGCMNSCCTGMCAAAVGDSAVGESCATDNDCPDDAYCGEDDLCRALSSPGEACRSDAQCAYGAGCIGASVAPGTCRSLPLLGEPCPYLRCAEIGAVCSAITHACVRSGPGAACESDADCSFYSLCNPSTKRCDAVPTLGMSCTSRCSGASWCDHDRSTCAPQFANGEPCRSGDQCQSLFCKEGEFFDACADAELCF